MLILEICFQNQKYFFCGVICRASKNEAWVICELVSGLKIKVFKLGTTKICNLFFKSFTETFLC